MNYIIFGFVIVFAVIVAEVSGRSACAACGLGEGTDYCRCDLRTNSYRARDLQPVSRVRGVQNSGVGDVCSCGHQVNVRPVALPRPKYVWSERSKVEKCDNRPLIPAPDHLHDFSIDSSQSLELFDQTLPGSSDCLNRPAYPIDVVSLDLVNRLQKSALRQVRPVEEKIQYGFVKLPREGSISSRKSISVPEEKLYTVDREIIELKTPRRVNCGRGSEELVVEDREPQIGNYLSYKDLGFLPEDSNIDEETRRFITRCRIDGSNSPAQKTKEEYVIRRGQSNEEENDDYLYKVKSNRKSCKSC